MVMTMASTPSVNASSLCVLIADPLFAGHARERGPPPRGQRAAPPRQAAGVFGAFTACFPSLTAAITAGAAETIAGNARTTLFISDLNDMLVSPLGLGKAAAPPLDSS